MGVMCTSRMLLTSAALLIPSLFLGLAAGGAPSPVSHTPPVDTSSERGIRFPPEDQVRLQWKDSSLRGEIALMAGDDLAVSCIGPSKVTWSALEAESYSAAAIAVAAANNNSPRILTRRDEQRDLIIRNVSGWHAGPYCCSHGAVTSAICADDEDESDTDTATRKCFYLYVNDVDVAFVSRREKIKLIAVSGRLATIPCRPTSKNLYVELIDSAGVLCRSWQFDPRRGFTKTVNMSDTGKCLCQIRSRNDTKAFILSVSEPSTAVSASTLEFPYLIREGADVKFKCTTVDRAELKLCYQFPHIDLRDRLRDVRENQMSVGKKESYTTEVTLSNVARGSLQVQCVVQDFFGARNATTRTLRVLPPPSRGDTPRLLLSLSSSSNYPAFVQNNRTAHPVLWKVDLAWEGKDVPIVHLVDPDGVETLVGSATQRSVPSIAWEKRPSDLPNPGNHVGHQAILIVKIPMKLPSSAVTESAQAGNYTVRARLVAAGAAGAGRRDANATTTLAETTQRLEVAIVGAPLPRFLNASSAVTAAGGGGGGGGGPLLVAPGDKKKTLVCVARALPPPTAIEWRWTPCPRGAAAVCDATNRSEAAPWSASTSRPGRGTLVSTLTVASPPPSGEEGGVITCAAVNSFGRLLAAEPALAIRRAAHKGGGGPSTSLVGAVVGVVALIIGVAVACVYFALRQKRARRRLHCAGLQVLVAGVPDALDPTLPADEQAELLPYDRRWEFPREDLVLGRQLGVGAFGVVTRAEARHIVEGEDVTTVAVKMVKTGADEAFLRALASELKILVHLGRHLNVVNLLGACTNRIAESELLVIVEYCPFGNLHNYLLRHREGFVDQLDPRTGQVDLTRGVAQLAAAELAARRARLKFGSAGGGDSSATNIFFSGSGGAGASDSGALTTVTYCPSGAATSAGSGYDSGGMSQPLSPMSSEDSGATSSGPQPLWRTNYRCDTRTPARILCTADLLSWAYQVSCGMHYLSQRKILHGDLAARNVLLARDGIVKICDFGLARSMYKTDTYKKKGDGPLPIKWMALESIRDRIFSTQSDVWSFGVVTWELFSLGATPYPGMQPSEEFYNKLVSGYRMECPQYAPAKVYELMEACWEADPHNRPTFKVLSSSLAALLDCSTRERIERLNADEQQRGGAAGDCDYLAMLGSPDYKALTSPASEDHHYVNCTPVVSQKVPEANDAVDSNPEPSSGYLDMSRPSTPGSNKSIFF